LLSLKRGTFFSRLGSIVFMALPPRGVARNFKQVRHVVGYYILKMTAPLALLEYLDLFLKSCLPRAILNEITR